jgi:hypothetical protein
MKVLVTSLPGVLIIEPKVFDDERGFFMETYHEKRYREAGVNLSFVQDNFSYSVYGTLRGFHYQYPQGQAKLVQVLMCEVFDVAVDIRQGSPNGVVSIFPIKTGDNCSFLKGMHTVFVYLVKLQCLSTNVPIFTRLKAKEEFSGPILVWELSGLSIIRCFQRRTVTINALRMCPSTPFQYMREKADPHMGKIQINLLKINCTIHICKHIQKNANLMVMTDIAPN